MQVTVQTAKFIAKKYKLKLDSSLGDDMNSMIFLPLNNINLGIANLYFLDNLFNDNIILGISAYNAGPGNVAKWLTAKKVPATAWIEKVPFGETRHYIRKVLMYMVVYNNFIFKDKAIKISNLLDTELSNKLSFR